MTAIRKSTIRQVPGRFIVAKTSGPYRNDNAFMISRDSLETTVVLAEKYLRGQEFEAIERWFILIQVDPAVPFQAPGFIATMASALARGKINIFPVSTFSRDYLLIHEEDANLAMSILKDLGFPVGT